MNKDGRSIYHSESGILLERMERSTIYVNIPRIVYDKVSNSRKVHDALKKGEEIFLLLAQKAHITKDPVRTAERNGYEDYELYLINEQIFNI